MKRIDVTPRPNLEERLTKRGLSFWVWDNYWHEGAAYKFTPTQIDRLEESVAELQTMCLAAAEHVAKSDDLLKKLRIPEPFWEPVRRSLGRKDFSLYGRFDLAWDGTGWPKMLEYNADTPTSLLESAVCQWDWLEDVFPGADQFNSLHDKLLDRWAELRKGGVKKVHFASTRDVDQEYLATLEGEAREKYLHDESINEEDWVCCHYLMDTAVQAGLEVEWLAVQDLGYDANNHVFVDLQDNPIEALFKLYPWEWLMREEFGSKISGCKTRFIEPMWKSILSNKGLLAVLWELYPGHRLLLPAYFEPYKLVSYAKKPLLSREGANVTLVENGKELERGTGLYGQEGYVYQGLCQLPNFGGRYPVIGAWVVGNEPAGICIREDSTRVTTNMSNFVPHLFTPE